MTLTDDAVALVESAYLMIQRYEETRDAALNEGRDACQNWLHSATRVLAASREPQPQPLEPVLTRIATALESIIGEASDGVGFVRIVTGDKA